MWYGNIVVGRQCRKFKYLIWLATVWTIWLERNRRVFQENVLNSEPVINIIKHTSWNWFVGKVGKNCTFTITQWWDNLLHCFNLV